MSFVLPQRPQIEYTSIRGNTDLTLLRWLSVQVKKVIVVTWLNIVKSQNTRQTLLFYFNFTLNNVRESAVAVKTCNRWLSEGLEKRRCTKDSVCVCVCVYVCVCACVCVTVVCFNWWFVYLSRNSTSLRPLWSEHWTCPALPKWDRQPCDPLNNLCECVCADAHVHSCARMLFSVCWCSAGLFNA